MKRQFQLFFVALLVSVSFGSPTYGGVLPRAHDQCNCTGTKDGGPASEAYVCRDKRLGPKVLPKENPLKTITTFYDRFGGLTPGEFLAKWTWPNGSYMNAPLRGFQPDSEGKPIQALTTLSNGTFLDRFGSESGSYLSARDAPFIQRSLPPSSLNTYPSSPYNYNVYRVIKPFNVSTGPTAPFYGQPGLGLQFYTGNDSVATLIKNKFLVQVNASSIGAAGGSGCF